ncbi:hypothetical protein EGW08_005849, partial [Elysia chlorotica]
MPDDEKVEFDPDFFSLPSPAWTAGLGTSIPFILTTAFDPNMLPPSLGPVREFALFLDDNYPTFMRLWAGAIAAVHSVLSVYAAKLCIDANMSPSSTIRWAVSTLFFGIPSLVSTLMPYLRKA